MAELLRVLGQGRQAVIDAKTKVKPFGTTYHALSLVTTSIDTLAFYLTGNAIYFVDPVHRTPGGTPAPIVARHDDADEPE